MPRARVLPPRQSTAFPQFQAKACPEDGSNCNVRGLLRLLFVGNWDPREPRDYTLAPQLTDVNVKLNERWVNLIQATATYPCHPRSKSLLCASHTAKA